MSVLDAPIAPDGELESLLRGKPRPVERIVLGILFGCGALSVLTTLGLIAVLAEGAFEFFREVPITTFFTDTVWQPFGSFDTGRFGVLPLVAGTLLVTVIATIVAVPLGVGAALYLSEYAPTRVRRTLKPALELLAGVPTVVLGFFALTFVTPLLRGLLGTGTVAQFNALSAGLVMGIMIIPTIASLSEDAMAAVPSALREGAYGLGATRSAVCRTIVLPAALSGIVAAIILGVSRAIGETMIVLLAAGSRPTLTANPFVQIQTMTAYIGQAVDGEASRGSLTYLSIFAVGALLFLLTFGLNLLAQRFVRRFREVY
jgi:phosphate transport system permease protein